MFRIRIFSKISSSHSPDLMAKRTVNRNNLIRYLKIFHLNIQCVTNKVDEPNIFLEQNSYELVFSSLHWLTKESINVIKYLNYSLGAFYFGVVGTFGQVSIYVSNDINFENVDGPLANNDFLSSVLCDYNLKIVTLYRFCSADFHDF